MTDTAVTIPPAPAPGPSLLRRVGRCTWRALEGLKTVLFFAVSGALAFADKLGAIDITPLLELVLPEGSKVSVSQVVILLSMAGIVLRFVTAGPMFKDWLGKSTSVDDGE